MAKKIGSLFFEIGAKTDGLDKGLKNSKNQAKSLADGFKSSLASIATVTAAIAGVTYALRQAYDIAKEGAALEYAEERFNRLTESIGSTSDAMLYQLQAATGGTRSEMELMASAADFMALGLAKSEDEVVRLSTVAGALNMDMNQLVLTLANQTTMRFDQLGVSVDGFEEKVSNLKNAGMDANAAFTEAFLQQAEEQVKRVGNAADSTQGDFMRFEASIKDVSASLKELVVDVIADAIPEIQKFFDQINTGLARREILSNLNDVVEALKVYGYTEDQIFGMSGMSKRFYFFDDKQAIEEGTNALTILNGVLDEHRKATDDAVNADYALVNSIFEASTGWDDFKERMASAGVELGMVTEELYLSEKGFAEYAGGVSTYTAEVNSVDLQEARDEYEETAKTLTEELAKAYDAVAKAEEGWRTGVAGDIKSELDKQWENLPEHKKDIEGYTSALQTLDNIYGTQYALEFKMEQEIPELVESLLTDPASFVTEAQAFEDYFMPLDNSIQNARTELAILNQELLDSQRTYQIEVQLIQSRMSGFIEQGGYGLPDYNLPYGGRQASGGPVDPTKLYMVGEKGPELFVPDTAGVIVPNNKLNFEDIVAQNSNRLTQVDNSELLTEILQALRSQPSAMRVALKEAMAAVGA